MCKRYNLFYNIYLYIIMSINFVNVPAKQDINYNALSAPRRQDNDKDLRNDNIGLKIGSNIYGYDNNGNKTDTELIFNNDEFVFNINGNDVVVINEDGLYSEGIKNIYLKTIKNPSQITSNVSDVIMWFDPSNRDLLNLDASNNLVNNASGYCVYDKTSYNNNLVLPVGSSGVAWDSNKKMITFLGSSTLSFLNNTTLNPSTFWTASPNTQFSYFMVVEESDSRSTGTVRGLMSFFYTTAAGSDTRCDILSSSNVNSYDFMSGANINMSTQGVHPTPTGFNYLGGKAIIGFVYGHDGTNYYRELYYNGIWCGKQVGQGGLDTRNREFILGGINLTATNNFNGFVGEIVCYKKALTRQEAIETCDYLNSKWDIYNVRECDIFVVGGQSNALGNANGTVTAASYAAVSAGTIGGYYCDPQYFYQTYETPIGCFKPFGSAIINFTLPNANVPSNQNAAAEVSGRSMWGNFADEYFKNTGRYVVFCYTPIGGSGMITSSQWNPYVYQTVPANFWNRVKDVLPLMVDKLQNNGWIVKGKYFIWNQGENTGDRNNADYLNYLKKARDIVLTEFGYDKYFYQVIAMKALTPEGNNYSQQGQLTYQFNEPIDKDFHMVFNANILNNIPNALQADLIHYTQLGYSLAGAESGKQCASIINKLETITARDINSVLKDNPIYDRSDVRFWGAVGNGLTDDTLALQNAFTNNNVSVYIPPGVYITSAALSISSKNNFKVIGNGATILRIGTTAPSNQIFIVNVCTFITIENLRILQNIQGLGGSNRALDISNSYGCNFFNCEIGGSSASGLGVVVGINISNPDPSLAGNELYLQFGITISNCNIVRAQWGMRIQAFTTNLLIEGCNFSYNSLNSILLQSNSTRNNIIGCNFSASNCAIRLDGIGKSVAGECDRLTIKNCSFKNISACGVYLNKTKNICSITGCDFNVAGDNVGLAWGFGVNNTAPNNLPSSSKWGIFLQGCENVNITGNQFIECIYGIGYNGASLINISNNNFLTSNSTIAHIWENRILFNDGTGGYNSNGNIICENIFEGNYSAGASTLLTKSIMFYSTPTTNEASTNHIITNNNNSTGFNVFYFIAGSPSGNYIIDANYSTIIFDLSVNPAGSSFTLHPSFFGREFKISYTASSSTTYNYSLILPINLTNAFLAAPNILCKGISYTQYNPTGPVAAFYTISNIGTYIFIPTESLSSLAIARNRWLIISENTYSDLSNIINDNIIVSKFNVRNINFMDSGQSRTLIFNSVNFTVQDQGFTFDVYIGDPNDTTNNDLIVENNLGSGLTMVYYNQRIHTTTTITGAAPVSLILGQQDRFYGFRFIYVAGVTGAEMWRIYQI